MRRILIYVLAATLFLAAPEMPETVHIGCTIVILVVTIYHGEYSAMRIKKARLLARMVVEKVDTTQDQEVSEQAQSKQPSARAVGEQGS